MPCAPFPTVPTLRGEKPGSRGGHEDEAGNRFYTLVFIVDAPPEYGTRAVAAVVPFRRGYIYQVGASEDDWHESDGRALCVGLDARQASADGTKWEVTVNFGPPQFVASNTAIVLYDHPAQAPANVRWEAEHYEEVVDKDVAGNAIVNAAGDKPNPGLTRPKSDRILVVEQYYSYSDWNDAVVRAIVDHTNASTFYGEAAGKWLCRELVPEPLWNTVAGPMVKMTAKFHHRELGWHARPLNDGTHQKIDGVRKPILAGGQPVSEPVPLAQDGTALLPYETPEYLDFTIIPAADFDALGINFP